MIFEVHLVGIRVDRIVQREFVYFALHRNDVEGRKKVFVRESMLAACQRDLREEFVTFFVGGQRKRIVLRRRQVAATKLIMRERTLNER